MLNVYKGFETELARLEKSCCYSSAYPKQRLKEQSYACVYLASCQHEDWWYKDLIGMEFFCRLVWYKNKNTGLKYLYSAVVIALTNTKQVIGRDFDPKDIIIL